MIRVKYTCPEKSCNWTGEGDIYRDLCPQCSSMNLVNSNPEHVERIKEVEIKPVVAPRPVGREYYSEYLCSLAR